VSEQRWPGLHRSRRDRFKRCRLELLSLGGDIVGRYVDSNGNNTWVLPGQNTRTRSWMLASLRRISMGSAYDPLNGIRVCAGIRESPQPARVSHVKYCVARQLKEKRGVLPEPQASSIQKFCHGSRAPKNRAEFRHRTLNLK